MPRNDPEIVNRLVQRCLATFVAAGSLDLSLDHLAAQAGTSKRMLIHYFGSRETLEQKAVALLEDRLRERFAAGQFPLGTPLETVISALWDSSTAPESRGVSLVIMDVSRRGWSGSDPARAFYREQQQLWTAMLRPFLADEDSVSELLQLFQGAIHAFLVTGDRDQGKNSLIRFCKRSRTVQPED